MAFTLSAIRMRMRPNARARAKSPFEVSSAMAVVITRGHVLDISADNNHRAHFRNSPPEAGQGRRSVNYTGPSHKRTAMAVLRGTPSESNCSRYSA